MDDADITQERLEREQMLRDRVGQRPPAYGPEECDQCGDEMPTIRRQHGFRLCVECQTLRERNQKMRRVE